MTAYQFLHIESASFTGRDTYRKVNGKREVAGHISVDSVLGEAGRLDGYISHIEKVLEPIILFGDTEKGIEDVRERLNKWFEETLDSRGHKMRKDANCLLSGVISWPPLLKNEDKIEYLNRMKAFEAKLIIALKEKYGDDLVLVIRHDDEPFKGVHAGQIHYHWHFFCIKKPGKKFDLHPGFKARAEFNISKNDRKNMTKDELKKKNDAGMKAYKDAMIAYQDWFYSFGKEFGLERYGPMRIRRSRSEQVELEKYVEKIINEANELKDDAETMKTEAETIKDEAESMKIEAENKLKEAENIKNEAISMKVGAEGIISEAISMKKDAENDKIEADKILKNANKQAEDIKSGAWIQAHKINISAKKEARSIIKKAENFINTLLDKIEALQGGKAIVDWAKTFMNSLNTKNIKTTSEKKEETKDLGNKNNKPK